MKSIVLAFFMLVLCGVCLSAQSPIGDSRTYGMGNAFTAVADDVNAIFYNPAGLAYLDEPHMSLGIDGSALLPYLEDEQAKYPYPHQGPAYQPGINNNYYYWDSSSNTDVLFDPSVYGFTYDPGAPESYEAAVQKYISWYEWIYRRVDYNIHIQPRFIYAEKNWGIALSSFNTLSIDYFMESLFHDHRTTINYEMYNYLEVTGAVAVNWGGIAFGANLSLLGSRKISVVSRIDGGIDMTDISSIVSGIPIDTLLSDQELSHYYLYLKLGIGALYTLGPVSIGTYSDGLYLPIAPIDGNFYSQIAGYLLFVNALYNLNIGVAYTPFYNRLTGKKAPWNFILSADWKGNYNIEFGKALSVGTEVSYNYKDIIGASVRLGFVQPVYLISFISMFAPVKISDSSFTLGTSLKLFKFFTLDLNAEVPYGMIINVPRDNPPRNLNPELFTIKINMSFDF